MPIRVAIIILLLSAGATCDVAGLRSTSSPENRPAGNAQDQRGPDHKDHLPTYSFAQEQNQSRRGADDLQLAEDQTKHRALALLADHTR